MTHEHSKHKKEKIIIIILVIMLILSLSIPAYIYIKNENKKTSEDRPSDLSCPSCNVIFINIELLRADYVGIISKEHGNLTPNIDKFFGNGIIFDDVSAPAGETIVSNIAVLTNTDPYIIREILLKNYSKDGQEYPNVPREYNSKDAFIAFPNIGQQLQNQGYYTVNINEGWQSGWATFMDIGFDVYKDEKFEKIPKGLASWGFTTTKNILQSLENKSLYNHQKFFLFFHGNRMHTPPYFYPINRTRISDPDIQYVRFNDYYLVAYDLMDKNGGVIKAKELEESNTDFMPAEELRIQKEKSEEMYIQELGFVDDELGKMFEILDEDNLTKNSIIVLYSNHGEGLFDNSIRSHGVPYQSCIHVPLLIRHPNITKQIRVHDSVALVDLTSAIYSMLNKSYVIPDTTNTIISNVQPKDSGQKLKEIYGNGGWGEYVRKGDMKLIRAPGNSQRLFNITADPHELDNVAEEYPQVVKELDEMLTAHEIEMQK